MSQPSSFQDLLDDAALLSHEAQEHLRAVIGSPRWRAYDLTVPFLDIDGDHPLHITDLHLLGESLPASSTWQWSWGSGRERQPALIAAALTARETGRALGIPELSDGDVPWTILTGAPTDAAKVAWRFVDVAKLLTGSWFGFTVGLKDGRRVGFLVEHPELTLPVATPESVAATLDGAYGNRRIVDYRRALRNYAELRGLRLDWASDEVTAELAVGSARLEVSFDEKGRYAATRRVVEGTLTSTQVRSLPPSPDPITLANLLDDAALLSYEHQWYFNDRVDADAPISVDVDQGVLEFLGEDGLRITGLHVLGNADAGEASWLWSWADNHAFAPELTATAQAASALGSAHGIAELAAGEVPFHALPGSPVGPRLAAAKVMDAAKILTGRWFGYTLDTGGMIEAYLVEHPDLVLPPPEPARVNTVLQAGFTRLELSDPRRALRSYAWQRGLDLTEDADRSQATVRLPGLAFDVRFDDGGRVASLHSSLG